MAPPLPPKPYIISSSPGRSEKLQTPGLARLLRGKSSSRSRNRTSRSSPLFSSKTRTINRTDAGDNGEPSSPKVTCIGQVRIRNNSKSNAIRSDSRKPNPDKKTVMCCCFIKRIVFRRSTAVKSIWKRLRITGHAGGYRERIEPADLDPDPVPAPFNVDGEGDESEIRVSVPPKNALVLMRCRSAPHNRSSSLAGRFFQIYVTGDGMEAVNAEEGEGKESGGVCDNGGEEEEEEEEDRRCRSSRPLFLKRCKSEPAAKAARLAAPAAESGGGGGECGWPADVLRQV